jgi:hypothetical protein
VLIKHSPAPLLNISTIEKKLNFSVMWPYMMMIYGWTSEHTVMIQSIVMPAAGVGILIVNIGYIFFNLGKR